MAIDVVLAEALKLPADERVELAERLFESLEAEADDPEHIAAWTQVIDRRIEEVRAGKAKLVDASDALRMVREAVRR